MSTTLFDDITGLLPSRTLSDAAKKLNEPEGAVMRGFQAASAAILGALAGKSADSNFMSQAFDLIKGPFTGGRIYETLSGFFSKPDASSDIATAPKFLSSLFGGDQQRITEKIGQASGLRFDSASKLLSFAAPAVLATLGKRVLDSHMDAAGLSRLLQEERNGISTVLPSGLGNLLRGSAPAPASGYPSYTAPVAMGVIEEPKRVWPWVVAAALAVGAILWMWAQSAQRVPAIVGQVTDPIHTVLANGVDLTIPKVGMESNFLTFLRGPNPTVDPKAWIEFDRLNFDTDSATLRPESMDQLGNVAAILKAYPKVKIKIGGYTDSSGNAAANVTLSQRRADSVRQQLISMGISDDRLQAEGYGDQFPVADNSSEQGRARNRRIAIRVTDI